MAMNHETMDEVRQTSSWLVGLGIVMLLLGLFTIIEPFVATAAIARLLSWGLLLAGIVRIVYAIQSWRVPGFRVKLLLGILYLMGGLLLLTNLFGAKLALTFVLGVVLVIQGAMESAVALRSRSDPGSRWMLFSGILAIIIGILILYRWPINATWLLGILTGVSFLLTGLWMIMLPWGICKYLSRYDSNQFNR
jgi:uncharacterized membrane protein HdeD (DUF308 family)